MNRITIKDHIFNYIIHNIRDDYEDTLFTTITTFYYDINIKKRRKYIFFGPYIEYTKPKYAFSVNFGIDSDTVSVEETRRIVFNSYNEWLHTKKKLLELDELFLYS